MPAAGGLISPESQALVAMLNGLDAESAVAAIGQVLTAKPELAPAIVSFAVPDLTYAPSRAFTERRARGRVKQYNRQSGFGFIECPELHAVFGKDVFVHAKQLASFEIGAEVTFAVVLNKDNKPQAVDLLTLDGKGSDHGKAAGKGVGDIGKGKMDACGKGVLAIWDGGKGKGDIWGKGSLGKEGKPSTAKPDEVATLGQFAGVIKSFNNKDGYGFGFIQSDGMKALGYTNDVYLHHLQLNGCEVSQEVSFIAYLNKKGQPQARDVVPISSATSAASVSAVMSALGQGIPYDQQGWSVVPPSMPSAATVPAPAPHVPVRAEFIDPLAQYQGSVKQEFSVVEEYSAEASQSYGDMHAGQSGYGSAAEGQQLDQSQWSAASPQLDQMQWSPEAMNPFALGHSFTGEDPEAKRQRQEQQGW